jgi:hypothetical protein
MPPPAPAAPPAAPAAPAPAPAPAHAAVPAAAPAKPAAPPERGPSPDWLNDIEGLETDRPPKPAAKPEVEAQAKPGDVAPPKPDEKPPVKPDEPPAETETRYLKTADVRTRYDALKKEKATVLEPKIQQLEARIKEIEAKAPEDTKPLVEKLTATEKRNAELEQQIQFVDYEKSSDYQTKYYQPFLEEWTEAVGTFGQLTIKEQIPDGVDEMDQPKFRIQTRQATADDLEKLANMPLSEMYEKVDELFGKASADVIGHIRNVKKLSSAMEKAKAKARKQSGEWSQQREIQTKQQRQHQVDLWTQFNKEIAERFAKLFGPEEGDTEGNALLAKGFATADILFGIGQHAKPQTPEEQVQFHAMMRNKIANHDRIARRLKVAQTELAETKAALEAYEKSEPPAGKGGGARTPTKTFDQETDAEIDALNRP